MSVRQSRMLGELLAGIVDVAPALDREVQGITLDSRAVMPGSMFMACAGISSHGLDYAGDAVRQGASVVLWEPSARATLPEFPGEVIAIEVPGLSTKAGEIASRWFNAPSSRMHVIGITGTNGKTSVSQLSAQALTAEGQRCAVVGTLGYGFIDSLEPPTHTTPDAVKLQALFAQLSGSGAEALAMEVSSHALEQHRVDGVHFRTAVFTNLTRDHLDYHGTLEAYAAAKRKLFQFPGLQNAVINADDEHGRRILSGLPDNVRAIAFATHAESVAGLAGREIIFARQIEFESLGLVMQVEFAGQEFEVRAPLFGRFNALNVLAVFGVLIAAGIAPSAAARGMSALRPVRGRMERHGGGEQPLVIVDYAHTPDALAQILSAAREHCLGELACVFGCGGDRDRGKRPEMGRIAEALADRVVVTDDNPRTEDGDVIVQEILSGIAAGEGVTVQRDRGRAIHDAVRAARKGDVVVIAGKGHEDYQVIGGRKEYFSDSETARAALGAWS